MSYLVLFVLVFFSPFSIAITSLGEERELILVFFVRLFDFCLFGFVNFPFLLVSGRGGGWGGCGLWLWHCLDFYLIFFCRSKIAKIVPNRNPRLRPSWKSFFLTSPGLKSQLTLNLVGSIGGTCRSKIAKIVPIGNPIWLTWPPSWKSIFCFFSWNERLNILQLGRKHLCDLHI